MNAVLHLSDNNAFGYGTIRSDRDNEYDVFARVTRMLRKSQSSESARDMIAAVHKNNELWTILATDLAAAENRLPDEIKAGLMGLASFALRRGHAVLFGDGDVQPLIDINLSVMKGLRGEVAE